MRACLRIISKYEWVCICMYVCMCVCVCVCVCVCAHARMHVCMCVCMCMYMCMQSVTVITFHHISCPMFCTKGNTVSSEQEVYELCHYLQCVQIYICFHELSVRVVVTNKHKTWNQDYMSVIHNLLLCYYIHSASCLYFQNLTWTAYSACT